MQARGVRAFGLFSIDGYYFRGIYEPPEGGKDAPAARTGQMGTGALFRQTQFRRGDTTVYGPPYPGRGSGGQSTTYANSEYYARRRLVGLTGPQRRGYHISRDGAIRGGNRRDRTKCPLTPLGPHPDRWEGRRYSRAPHALERALFPRKRPALISAISEKSKSEAGWRQRRR